MRDPVRKRMRFPIPSRAFSRCATDAALPSMRMCRSPSVKPATPAAAIPRSPCSRPTTGASRWIRTPRASGRRTSQSSAITLCLAAMRWWSSTCAARGQASAPATVSGRHANATTAWRSWIGSSRSHGPMAWWAPRAFPIWVRRRTSWPARAIPQYARSRRCFRCGTPTPTTTFPAASP